MLLDVLAAELVPALELLELVPELLVPELLESEEDP